MKQFESSEQLKEVLGGFFLEFVDRMKAGDPAFVGPGEALNNTNLVVHFDLKDPELLIVIDCEQKPIGVSFGKENPKAPTATFYVSAENGHKFWCGALNLPNALIRKQVILKGPVSRLLRVVPITRRVYPLYLGYLTDHNYQEFIPEKKK
jgi:hypothetical protein